MATFKIKDKTPQSVNMHITLSYVINWIYWTSDSILPLVFCVKGRKMCLQLFAKSVWNVNGINCSQSVLRALEISGDLYTINKGSSLTKKKSICVSQMYSFLFQ